MLSVAKQREIERLAFGGAEDFDIRKATGASQEELDEVLDLIDPLTGYSVLIAAKAAEINATWSDEQRQKRSRRATRSSGIEMPRILSELVSTQELIFSGVSFAKAPKYDPTRVD